MQDSLQYIAIVISIGSLLAAWLAVIITYRGHRTAKRNLLIAEEQAAGRHPSIIPYLIDGFVSTSKDRKKKIYTFSISLTNRSDVDNSVTDIELFLNYYRPRQPMTSLLLPHDCKLSTSFDIKPRNILITPLILPSHQAVTGNILFECDNTIISDVIIDSYDIRITDSNGLYSKLQPIIIQEIVDEKETT